MSREQKVMRALDDQVDVRRSDIIAALVMTVQQQAVYCTCNTATDSYSITLPNVTEAAGKIFSFYCTLAANSKAVTLQDNDESIDWDGDYTIDTTADAILLYSDGMRWCVLENKIA